MSWPRLSSGALVAVLACAPLTAQQPPHIVVILADDLGIGDLGSYNDASKAPTPRLDRIAAAGMRFTDMHSPSGVCTPTRYGLLTGRYCWRSRMKQGVLNGYSPALLEPGRLTMASMLRKAGYRTVGIGKWHLGLGTDQRTDYSKTLRPGPMDAGFDHYFGIPASLDMAPYVWFENARVVEAPTAKTVKSAHRRQNGGGFWRGGPIAPGFKHADVLPTIGDRAAEQIEKHAADQPLFMYVALSAPHTPWLPSDAFRGKSQAGYYGDFVAMVDAVVGQIDDALERQNMRDNTLLIVTSDNGAHWPVGDIEKYGHRANGPFRGQKADIHEGGHRVPFLARWPGRVDAGSTCAATTCLTDVFATAAAIAGASFPNGAGEDSFDLSPALRGEDLPAGWRAPVVHHSAGGMFAIRRGRWKLVLGRGSGGFTAPRWIRGGKLAEGEPRGQLYDLERDPAEQDNLWSNEPALAAELCAVLEEYRTAGRSAPRRSARAK